MCEFISYEADQLEKNCNSETLLLGDGIIGSELW